MTRASSYYSLDKQIHLTNPRLSHSLSASVFLSIPNTHFVVAWQACLRTQQLVSTSQAEMKSIFVTLWSIRQVLGLVLSRGMNAATVLLLC